MPEVFKMIVCPCCKVKTKPEQFRYCSQCGKIKTRTIFPSEKLIVKK